MPYATDALISEIDEALNRKTCSEAKQCASHAHLAADIRLLLRCQRAELLQGRRILVWAVGISTVIATIIAVVTAVGCA